MHIYIHTSMHSLIHAYKRSKYNAQSQNLLKAISFYEQTGEETVYKLNRYKKRPCTNSTGRPTGKVCVQTQQVQEKSVHHYGTSPRDICKILFNFQGESRVKILVANKVTQAYRYS